MNRENNFCVVALMDPFQNKRLVDRYRRRLNIETAYANINGQIWLFFDAVVEWELVEDTEQQLVGVDFNVILHEDEKKGGLPVHPPEYEDFVFYVNSYGLFEQGYKGSPFTWWNGRYNIACIFKILDRIIVNLSFQNILPTIEVEYLIRTGSDHAQLLMTCGEQTTNVVKPFRFLNFWTKHATFMDVVRQNWEADFIGDPFFMFKQKLKRVKEALSKWNRETFGDIFKQLALLEDIAR
ncbi:uncharacterized protein [Nicotiana sylvestris]|uniref:uncharacterized protein n=1 Tax=Nicotiana sylvestris TaxID=4096 RepID=UPI00388C9B5F